jgi:hypothetical protein
MKKFLIVFMLFVLILPSTKADEGMWFLAFINKNYSQMKAMGFKLTPQDIYDINHSCMKDAVVTLDGGSCTAEMVSPNGLLFTNHHCGYGEIQAHSSVDHDYLTNGFWARSYEEELPNPEKSVTFLVRMEDVSDQVNAVLNDKMTEEERELTIKKISEKIEKEAIGTSHYEAKVRSFFSGNNFYLFVLETFKDVRLVGAPPSAIGKFGGDTDNWMWPRHTGDFSIFRVYCGKDGKPAEYSKDNVPYKPKHFFPISLKGVKENDFSMIMGYPGTTTRYLTSWGVQETMDNQNSIRVEVRGIKQDIMKKYMDKSEKTRIQYSDKYYSMTNYYKYSIGQNKALVENKVIDKKKATEKAFEKWIKAKKSERKEKYGDALTLIKDAYASRVELDKTMQYWDEVFYFGPEIISLGYKFTMLHGALNGKDKEKIDESVKSIKSELENYFKNFDVQVDKEIFVAMLNLYKQKIKSEYLPAFYTTIDTEFGGDVQKYADQLYSSSILTDKSRAEAFLENPDLSALQGDLGYYTTLSALGTYWDVNEKITPFNQNLEKGMRKFVDGWKTMETDKDKEKLFYPDANSTIRLTYGKVGGYKVGKTVYDFTTDLKGLMAKENPSNEEFIVPARLKELYKNNDFGDYGENGKMTVCFISNNDITGGNSGSPVLNGEGQLIGIAFDGNWEAMSGDINFDTKLNRTICVDIRYVLFIIDKYAGAKNLIDELTLVRK